MAIEQGDDGERIFYQTRHSFCESLHRAMKVVGDDDVGEPSKITQHALAKRSGVARSTIAKYMANCAKAEVDVNPDLETLCRLASALNVPPALLLMRSDDWARLPQAAGAMQQAMADAKVNAISEGAARQDRGNTVAHAKAGLRIAERIGTYPARVSKELGKLKPEELDRLNRTIRQGALAASSLPPFAELRSEYMGPLLSLCVSLSANGTIEN